MSEDHDKFAKMFKALAHPNRFRLFVEILEQGESSVEEGHACFVSAIMDRLEIGAPTVSHHIKELVQAGLVTTERRGKFLACRIDPDAFDALRSFFAR